MRLPRFFQWWLPGARRRPDGEARSKDSRLVGGGKHDAFDGQQALRNLAERDFDGAHAIVEAADIGAKLGVLGAKAGMLGDEQAPDHQQQAPEGADDPLRIRAGHISRINHTEFECKQGRPAADPAPRRRVPRRRYPCRMDYNGGIIQWLTGSTP